MKVDEFLSDLHQPRPELLDALIQQESAGNNNAVSKKGARGLAQIMPKTAKNPGYGVTPLQDSTPQEQRRFANDYLGAMLKEFGGNERLALAAYNAGPGAVKAHKDVPPYPETQNYVAKILGGLNPISEAQADETPYQEPVQKIKVEDFLADLAPQEQPAPAPTPQEQALLNKSGPSQFLMGAGNAVINPVLGLGQLTGLVNDETVKKYQQQYAPLEKDSTAYGAGKLLGDIFVGSKIPGGGSLRGAVAGQAALGAAQPAFTGQDRALNAGLGAAGGALGYAIPAGIGKILNPKTKESVKSLMAEGVTPTPGQILGGGFNRLEEGATSVPFLGDMIKNAKGRAIEDFNVAAYNRALNPIGETFDKQVKPGHEGMVYVYDKLSNAYDDLLPNMRFQRDNAFDSELQNLRTLADDLPEDRAKQFNKIIDNKVLSKFTSAGLMHPEQMKKIQSELGEKVRLYMGSSDADQRELSTAFQEAQAILRRAVERQNPEYATELKNIDKGYANLVRLERAASTIGSKEGVFSPAQLKNASRALDPSLRKRQSAQGKALLQKFSEEGQDILGQKVPDSGTPFRLGAMTGLGASYLASPTLPLGILGLSGGYTPLGQKTLASLLTQRSDLSRKLGEKIGRQKKLGASIGSASLLNSNK